MQKNFDISNIWDASKIFLCLAFGRTLKFIGVPCRYFGELKIVRIAITIMVHSTKTGVPLLDHEVAEFATRSSHAISLGDGLGKRIFRRVDERFVDYDVLCQQKRRFDTSISWVFANKNFGQRCIIALKRSKLREADPLDNDPFESMLAPQIDGSKNSRFHVWAVLNAIMWHAYRIEGRKNCL